MLSVDHNIMIKMKTTFSCILVLVHILYVLLHSNDISCHVSRTSTRSEKYCGPKLANVLEEICVEYLPPADVKRSNSIRNDYLATKHGSPFLNHRYVLSSLFRRNRRDETEVTAYAECCAKKGCTIGELLQYCGVPRF